MMEKEDKMTILHLLHDTFHYINVYATDVVFLSLFSSYYHNTCIGYDLLRFRSCLILVPLVAYKVRQFCRANVRAINGQLNQIN